MKEVEFLIVGQGLAGTMLAFELLERNISFRLVSSTQKSKASVVAAGMINPLVFKRLTKSWMADQLMPVMRKRYRELEQKLSSSFFYEKKILKPLSEQETLLWNEKMEKPDFATYIEAVLPDSPSDAVAESYAFGMVKESGYVNLAVFLSLAEQYFREKDLLLDVDFQLNEEVHTYFEVADTKAQKIVFCEGYHLAQNTLFRFVKMNPAKGEVLQIYAPGLSEEFILNKRVFVLPVGNHRFKVGSTYEWDDLSEKTTEKGRDSIVERLENLVTAKYSIEEHWAGVRPTVSDRRPLLGVHPQHKNVFSFNGLGTKGVMLAPWFARLMADYLQGKSNTLPAEVDLNRFV
ncbi:FAD-binding oxidoreductase [Maribellus sp. YY47]|uniref:NAD(P)/FAD-dependent oxidoreductase n=1 Tax=Maribellus sp. YY47 TaxID=2929486 RepID=UPI0020006FC3|nr:FAD-binding oxidoreductase [Maribellus sp. YY47]MCK3684772.1 FAD-binding oxidoreductase [Maribellus sp. YY47]